MSLSETEQIQFNKQSKQQALDTFSFDYNNNFDRPIDSLINSLIEESEQASKKYQYYEKLQKEKSDEYWELQDKFHYADLNFDMVMMDHIQDIMYLEEEIIAICETKIIYGFKHFEISLKKLLGIAFGTNDHIKKFKWHELINFFKQKNIDILRLDGYEEINQLRIINNVLKHSNEKLDAQISAFPEFVNQEIFHFPQLIKFYDRVKTSPATFLNSLSRELHRYLYQFSDQRIESLAESYALRMNKKDAENFMTRLRSKY